MTGSSQWRPIAELEDRYIPGLLLYAESLVSEDFNPEGVVEGHWQDGDGIITDLNDGEWVAAVWCDYHDTYETIPVKPTHFMLKPKFEGPKQ